MEITTSLSVMHEMEEGAFPSPDHYVLSGWCRYLPHTAIIVLNLASSNVVQGLTKEESIRDIAGLFTSKKEGPFFDFEAPKPKGKRKLEEYNEELKQEGAIKEVLERSGYKYPKTVEDMADLFVKLGLMFERTIDDKVYLDVLLAPYSNPKDMLQIKEE